MIAFGLGSAVQAESPGWQSRIAPRVLVALDASHPAGARFDAHGRLQIDIHFDCGRTSPAAALAADGMVIGTSLRIAPLCVVEGWAAPSILPALAGVEGVTRIDLPKYSKRHPRLHRGPASPNAAYQGAGGGAGAIDGNGIGIMNSAQFTAQTGVNGGGVTVGVISDDVHSLSVIQSRGELPPDVQVVLPSNNSPPHTTFTDEGTMMLEEVYAVAPGASLAFCGPETLTEYLGCLQNLIGAGATIIADDLAYVGTDVFTAPAVNGSSAPIETLLTANTNVLLFHSVGNDEQDYWQGSYAPIALAAASTCTGGGSSQTDGYFQPFTGTTQFLEWTTLGGNPLYLASVLPSGQTLPNAFDLYVFDYDAQNQLQQVACAGPATREIDGATSYTVLDGSSLGAGTYYIAIATAAPALAGTFLKLVGVGDGADTFSTVSTGAPVSPQDFAAGVVTVGAVYGGDGVGNSIEAFSDVGPIQVELPTAAVLQAPVLVAPDGIAVDNAGTQFGSSTFYGTSAASPNAAAVATLVKATFPSLTPSQVTAALQAGADVLPAGGQAPNGTYGYGRIDATGTLQQLSGPTISALGTVSIVDGGMSGALPFTLGGTGNLTVSIASDNTALVPANAPAVGIAPSGCGSSTRSCTLTVTPSLGQIGTAHITLTATDATKRTASSTLTVSVTKPPVPTVTITGGNSQTVVGGGSTTNTLPITFTLTGSQTLTVAVTSSNPSLLPASAVSLSAGCGTSVFACTASLGVVAGQTGTSTITIRASDAFAQTSAASATLAVNRPAAPTVAITGGAPQTITGSGANSPTTPITFTLTGTPTLAVAVTSSNQTLLPASGISLSNGCGADVLACSVTLTIAADQAGSSTITIQTTDAYAQSATATAALTVQKPTPPTVSINTGSAQTINEGGSLTPVSFTLTGTQPLTITAVSSNGTLVPASNIALSSGCGSSSETCTGTVTAVAGQSGTSTITIDASDPYGQSGTAAAVVTVAAPSHGGGSLDVESLIALACLAVLTRRRPARGSRTARARS
jgi:hypothetical protein